jgi:hypothetical protein
VTFGHFALAGAGVLDRVPLVPERHAGRKEVRGLRETNHVARFGARQENGSLSSSKVGGKVRVTGVYHAYATLYPIDETVAPGAPILLEAAEK